MSDPVARFTISVPPDLLATFDEVCSGKGYASRSEAVRDALRDYLVAHAWETPSGPAEVVGTLTLVHDADSRDPAEELRERHRRVRVISTLSVPLEGAQCLEVVVLRGSGEEVAALADALISRRGVHFGRLVYATAGASRA